jgi:hypothetical protein
VDNASTVPVPDEPGIDVVRSPQRLPLGAARNLGVVSVTTAYVVVWDADDTMLPGTLSMLEAAMRGDPGLVAFGAGILEDEGGPRHRWPRPWVARLLRAPRLFALVHSVWSVYPATGATIMRTDLVRECGGYPATPSGEDWVLGVSLAYRGRVGWTERPGRVYRRHANSVWATHGTARDLRAHAREVRARLRADPGVPGWARMAVPGIACIQLVAIALSRLVAARRVRSR